MSYVLPKYSLEAENLSGILQINIARASEISSFPARIGNILLGDIGFVAGAGFVTWHVIQGSSSFQDNSQDSMEGIYRSGSLPFSLPARMIDELQLNRMESDAFVILFKDMNQKVSIWGSPERPLRFRYAHGTGSLGSGRNDYSCSFSNTAKGNIFRYDGAVVFTDPKVIILSETPRGDIIATLSEGESYELDGDFFFREIMIPLLPSNIGRFANVNGKQIELGKTIIIKSEFTTDFDIA